MKTIKNITDKPLPFPGHEVLQPGESRPVPDAEADYLAGNPGIEIVGGTERPTSKSEERRLASQRPAKK